MAEDRTRAELYASFANRAMLYHHIYEAAKAKLATLPNNVALASLVMWIPTCQAARSAAKNRPAKAMIMPCTGPGACSA